MIVLAFDSAMAACSAGVWRDGQMLSLESLHFPQGHAEVLMPMIERVMKSAAVKYEQLDRIAVTVGPGSFTGLRVGLATARGLAMAASKPAIGITTCEALAAAVPASERCDQAGKVRRILSVIDSKRGDVFAQSFGADGKPEGEVVNVTYQALGERFKGALVLVGDGTGEAIKHFGPEAVLSSAPTTCSVEHIARLAAAKEPNPLGPLPLYVRAPDVTLPPDNAALRP